MKRALLLLLAAVAVCDVLIVTVGGREAEAGPTRVEVVVTAPARLPTLRPAAQQPTPEGATAFARHWFDALNYSLAHATDQPLVSVTGAGCQQCAGWILGIQKWKAAGLTLDGGLTVPATLAIGAFSTAQPVWFAATYLITPATLTDKSGNAQSYPGGRTRGGLTVLWANGRWQMTDIVLDLKKVGP